VASATERSNTIGFLAMRQQLGAEPDQARRVEPGMVDRAAKSGRTTPSSQTSTTRVTTAPARIPAAKHRIASRARKNESTEAALALIRRMSSRGPGDVLVSLLAPVRPDSTANFSRRRCDASISGSLRGVEGSPTHDAVGRVLRPS
jgi:hypothetical protein